MSSRVNISNHSIKKKNKLNSPWDQDRQVYRDCLVFLANPVRKQGIFLSNGQMKVWFEAQRKDDQFSALQKTKSRY